MAFNLQGKVAIVTGAARGIGAAIAALLAESGTSVVASDLDGAELAQTAGRIRAAGGEIHTVVGDITRPETPQVVVDSALSHFGGVDIVVNNAGYTWDNVIQKTSDDQFQAMLDIHVVAPFRLLRAASVPIRESAKREIAEGRRVMRKVVNISSVSATYGIAGQAGYASGKGAILGLTQTLAKEWGRYNVNVNAVAFGMIETRLVQPLDRPDPDVEIAGRRIRIGVHPQAIEAARENAPLGRLGTPEEAASAVLFFCSPLSDFVTGELLTVSGGLRF